MLTGCCYSKIKMSIAFVFMFFSVNLTFFPMHFSGLKGIPRKVVDYPDYYVVYNSLSSWGSFLSIFSIIFFLYVVVESLCSYRILVVDLVSDNNSLIFRGGGLSVPFGHSYGQSVIYIV